MVCYRNDYGLDCQVVPIRIGTGTHAEWTETEL